MALDRLDTLDIDGFPLINYLPQEEEEHEKKSEESSPEQKKIKTSDNSRYEHPQKQALIEESSKSNNSSSWGEYFSSVIGYLNSLTGSLDTAINFAERYDQSNRKKNSSNHKQTRKIDQAYFDGIQQDTERDRLLEELFRAIEERQALAMQYMPRILAEIKRQCTQSEAVIAEERLKKLKKQMTSIRSKIRKLVNKAKDFAKEKSEGDRWMNSATTFALISQLFNATETINAIGAVVPGGGILYGGAIALSLVHKFDQLSGAFFTNNILEKITSSKKQKKQLKSWVDTTVGALGNMLSLGSMLYQAKGADALKKITDVFQNGEKVSQTLQELDFARLNTEVNENKAVHLDLKEKENKKKKSFTSVMGKTSKALKKQTDIYSKSLELDNSERDLLQQVGESIATS